MQTEIWFWSNEESKNPPGTRMAVSLLLAAYAFRNVWGANGLFCR